MNKIKQTFIGIQMLGIFGLILTLAMGILGLAIYNLALIEGQVETIKEHSLKSSILLQIEYGFIEEELAERTYVLHQDEESIEKFKESDEQLTDYIEEFKVLSDSDEEIEKVDESRDQVREAFEEIVADVDSGKLTTAELDRIFLGEAAINEQLEKMVFEAEVMASIDYEEGVEMIEQASLIVIGGMILFPFLAVWAYFTASRLTSPLLSITNAIMAAGGSHYHSDLLEDTINKFDGIGQLSQAVDTMVKIAEDQENQLRAELTELTQQLRENRKHKLTRSPVKKSSE